MGLGSANWGGFAMGKTGAGELPAALVVIITLARASGAIAGRLGQPAVASEIPSGGLP
jgi:hypothetical protein